MKLEFVVVLYFLSYLPNIVLTRLATSMPHPELARSLTGLETLPATLTMNMLLTYAFIWLSGWHRDAHAVQLGTARIPVPTRYTLLSGIGTALVLIIAPLVDLMFGRRVRWWSWTALLIVALALTLVVHQRGGFHLPPLAVATVILYTVGYFLRLAVMTRIAKRDDPALVRQYFVEEKVIALPMSILALAALSLAGLGTQGGELAWGFTAAWTDPAIWPLAGSAVSLTVISVFAAIILLSPQENSYCVPLERSSSLLAGLGAAWLLHLFWGQARPTGAEMLGAALLLGAIVLLTLAPRHALRRSRAQ